MKKNLSVLGLFARSTLYPILCLLALMTAADIGLFLWALATCPHAPVLEPVLQDAHLIWPFAAVFGVTGFLLCATGCEFSAKQDYTLRRLAVSEFRVYLLQAGYNILCFFLLWFWQGIVVYTLCKILMAHTPAQYINSQTLMLAFYRNDFIHNLIPMANFSRWVRNVLLMLFLGLGCAYFPLKQRQGKFPVSTAFAFLFAVIGFSYGLSQSSEELLFLTGPVLLFIIGNIFLAWEVTKHEED